jgi:hypothetical protein
LILGFQEFLKENPGAKKDARLIFLGGVNHYSLELSEYERDILQFKVSPDYLPFKMVQSIQKRSSANIILEAKSKISPFLPGKFPHCVSANRLILHLGPYKSESKRLLGESYEYWAEIDDVRGISEIITKLYDQWKRKPESMILNRPDLEEYLSIPHLKKVIDGVFENLRNRKF